MERRRLLLLFGLLVSIALIVAGLLSMRGKEVISVDKYPDRPITVTVSTSAGSGPDLMVRAMEKAAMKNFGQPFLITNMPGGAGTKSWNELAGAKPDGYTIGVTTTGLILQPLYGPTRYHYPSALDPLAQVVTMPIVAVVRADQPWDNIADIIHFARLHPGTIKFGHPGLGSPRHVVGEMFAKEAGIQITQVPFEGEPESLTALLGGHIQLVFVDTSVIKDHLKNGKIKILAVATEARLPDSEFAQVPTFREQGCDIVFSLWYGIGAPKGLSKEIKSKLVTDLQKIIQDPEFQIYMAKMGMTVSYLGPQESGDRWLTEQEQFAKVIRETGIAELIANQKR